MPFVQKVFALRKVFSSLFEKECFPLGKVEHEDAAAYRLRASSVLEMFSSHRNYHNKQAKFAWVVPKHALIYQREHTPSVLTYFICFFSFF